jgi:hypothetical protein
MSVTIDGVWIEYIDHLQVITTNNYNTVAISILYSSLMHPVWCSQAVNRRFLVMASTVAIPLPLGQVLP